MNGNKIVHLDLFSGIGGFALAVDQVWSNVEHIFCDNDKFCKQVLKKHWPNSQVFSDIRELTPDTLFNEYRTLFPEIRKKEKIQGINRKTLDSWWVGRTDILTGGPPCQPVSQAGKRRGTTDNRWLWPEMFRVIQFTKPTWIIVENVRGLLTIEQGMVFEQMCLDLEREDYEVQPFIIPAVSLNAPHRRDRIWIIAHRKSIRDRRGTSEKCRIQERKFFEKKQKGSKVWSKNEGCSSNVNNTKHERLERYSNSNKEQKKWKGKIGSDASPSWSTNWIEVATKFCGVDDEFSDQLDFAGWTKAGHRIQRLKTLGNAIVPAVAVEILKAIKFIGLD